VDLGDRVVGEQLGGAACLLQVMADVAGGLVEAGDVAVFPAHLRVKPITSAPGVFEMTWSFSGPDGRASFQWATITLPDGTRQAAVRWRRIGTHRIFGSP